MEASNFRRLILELDRRFPGFGHQIDEGMAVAIDGEIYQDAYLAPAQPRQRNLPDPEDRRRLSSATLAQMPIAHDDRATLRSRSTLRFKDNTRPSTPSRRRMELNSERWTASWLIEPSR